MLDHLRAMGVFACVVEKNSFSGAARDLGITTSAVSQQIRALEHDMDVTLLHRSTRKLSLTESGQAFFQSCKEMLIAAERGKIKINELRDDLVGDLRIASTPELSSTHIVPALSFWLSAHKGLSMHLEVDNQHHNMIDDRIDIAIRLASKIEDENLEVEHLAQVDQILVAAPNYINQHAVIHRPEDLLHHELIHLGYQKNGQQLQFTNVQHEVVSVHLNSKFTTNNEVVQKAMCIQGHGLMCVPSLFVQQELATGKLIEILPDWQLPTYSMYAVMACKDQQPMKVVRCLETLKQYCTQTLMTKKLLKAAS